MKVNVTLLILFLMVGFNAAAQLPVVSKTSSVVTQYASEFTEIINRLQLQHDTAYPLATVPVADACVSMMNKEMVLGNVGTSIFKEITRNSGRYVSMLDGGSMTKYCRKYSSMDSNQRALVWVLVMTTMAHFESQCSERAKAKGPNGIAAGYFQLHRGKESQYVRNEFTCARNASSSAVQSSQCALGMLERQMERSGEVFDNKSYWEVLRPKGPAAKARLIERALVRSSLCNPMQL